MEHLVGLMRDALPILQPILVLVLTWLSALAANWIRVNIKHQYLRSVLLRLDDTALAVVKELQQTVVDDLKAAAEDGKLEKDEIEDLRKRAVERVTAHLGERGVEEARRVLGVDSVAGLIESKLEAAVRDLRESLD